jgi:hypothetical protein
MRLAWSESRRHRAVASVWQALGLALAGVTHAGAAQASSAIIVGTDADPARLPEVTVFDGVTLATLLDGSPYLSYTGGVRVAGGDVSADGHFDLVTATGAGTAPAVLAFDGRNGNYIDGLSPFPSFTGGVYVASGDIDRDGHADMIVGAGAGGSPIVTAYSGRDNSVLFNFFAYDPGMTAGVRVAAGDVNCDGHADIIVAPGPGAPPLVRVFDGVTGSKIYEFYAYAAASTYGVFVAAADFDGDGCADIVTGSDAGATPTVKVFSGTSHDQLQSFLAYASEFSGGVRVAAGDIDGDGKAEIVTVNGPGASAEVKVFTWPDLQVVRDFLPFSTFSGGAFVPVPSPGDVIFANSFNG